MAASEARRLQAVRARVNRVRLRLDLEVYARAAVVPVWVASCAFVTWRLFVPAGVLPFAAVSLSFALLATWFFGRRHATSFSAAAVVADRLAQAGGLLLTRLERPVETWELDLDQHLKRAAAPSLEVRRPLALLSGALLFVAVGLVVPVAWKVSTPNASARARVEALQAEVEALAVEDQVPEALRDELERLQNELATERFDAADWEAADALEETLSADAAQALTALAAAERATSQLEAALGAGANGEALARQREALEQALLELGDGAGETGTQALEQALSQARAANDENASTGAQGTPGTTGAQGGEAQQLQALARALAQRREQLARRFDSASGQSASRAPGQLGSTKRPGQGSGQGEGEGDHEGQPGAGRGGESKALSFSQTELHPERLDFEALPPGAGGEGQSLLGLQKKDPPGVGTAARRATTGAAAAGGTGAGHERAVLRPKNRASVERYFAQ